MRLVDTSAWIEWLMGSPTGKLVASEIPPRDMWLVPTIIQLELAKWLTRERGEDTAHKVMAFTRLCVVAPLDTALALAAAEASRRHGLATTDAIIYATAQIYGAEVLTCDAHFGGLHGVIFTPKDGLRS